MTNERLFRAIGQLDDRILERYHTIDQRLLRKTQRKRAGVRVLAIAACVAMLLGVCLPIAALSHPIGRAILQGDSEALTLQLLKLEGFAPWQERVSERLEKQLPDGMWELLQTTPLLDVLTQSQYPAYACKGMEFEAYLQEPVYMIYEIDDSEGVLGVVPQIDVRAEKFTSDQAPRKYVAEMESGTYQLTYAYSQAATLGFQAVDVYMLYSPQGTYVAYLDMLSGECIYWESPERAAVAPEGGVTEESMQAKAYEMLRERVRDPEAYTLAERMYNGDGTYTCEYSRLFHSLYTPRSGVVEIMEMTPKTCDKLSVTFDCAGNIVGFDLGYLGALRNADPEIPPELFASAYEYYESFVEGASYGSKGGDMRIVITRDGRLAFCRSVEYQLHRQDGDCAASMKYLAYLTKADPSATGGYEILSDGTGAGQRVRLSQNVYTPGSNYENVRNEFTFDKNGNKITEIAYYDGKEYYRVNYTYDEQGHMTVVEYVSQESEMLNFRYEYEYGENGLPVKQTIINSKGEQTNEILFEYDEQGREIRHADKNEVITYTYGENGSYVERTESLNSDWVSESEIVYDKNGFLILEHTVQNGNDTKDQYEYDEQGRVIRRETLVNGELLAYRTLEYRDGKLYRAIHYNASGKITSIELLEYNEYSECILSDYRDAKGKLIQSMSYEYGTVDKE